MACERHGGFDTKDAGSQLDDATAGLPCLVDFLRGPSSLGADGQLPICIAVISTGRDLLHEIFRVDSK